MVCGNCRDRKINGSVKGKKIKSALKMKFGMWRPRVVSYNAAELRDQLVG